MTKVIERIRKAIASGLTRMFGTGMTRYLPPGPYNRPWDYPVRSGSEVQNPLDQVCSVSEAALTLGKGGRRVRRMIERGELDARKSGGVWLVRVEKKVVL